MDEIRKYIESGSYYWRSLQKQYSDVLSEVKKKHPDLHVTEALYIELYGNGECKVCGSKPKFISLTKGYRDFCSLVCSNKSDENIQKKSSTLKNKSEEEKEQIKSKKIETYQSKSHTEKQFIRDNRIRGHRQRSTEEEARRREKISSWWKSLDDDQYKSLIVSRQTSRLQYYYKQLLNRCEFIVQPLFSEEEFIGVDHTIKYTWKCLKCNSVFKDDCDDGKLPRCTKCYPKNTYSYKEHELYDFVKGICNDAVSRDRTIISPKEIDIFIPSKSIAIEFCGIYWHSDQFLDKRYHYNKFKKCLDKGIHLITIFEDQWDNKQEIVKDRLKSVLGCSEKIYARNTSVVSISNKESEEFINKHHIQGYISGSVIYGLFNSNELVAIMSFVKDRYNKSASYELLRYCSKGTIVGGASKLFSAFIKDYSPDCVISYADRCWSKGVLYQSLGFVDITRQESNVGYNIISKTGQRYHRSSFKKSDLIKKGYDKAKSQTDILRDMGYRVVWNCGNYKFEWKKGETMSPL